MRPSSLFSGRLPAIRWSGVAGGAAAALALHVTLGLFVSALGAAAAHYDSRALAFSAGLLGFVVPLFSTSLGAWLTIRLSGITHPGGALVHGLMVWAVGLVAGVIFLTGSTLTTLSQSEATRAALERRAFDTPTAPPAAGAYALGGIAALLGALGGLWGATAARRSLLEAAALTVRQSGLPLNGLPADLPEPSAPNARARGPHRDTYAPH